MSPRTRPPIDGSTQRRRSKRSGVVNSGPGHLLFVARRAARLTQRQLATRAGVDHSFISLIEAGERDLRAVGYETVATIAEVLNVTPADLCPRSSDTAKESVR
jgi:transcriptional regulator with XRE-family HTH domain